MIQIKIVEDIEEERKKTNRYVEDVLKEKIKIERNKAMKTIILTPSLFNKVFSNQRLSLLLKIKKNNVKNIYQLAKETNRHYEAVYRDVKYLEGFGIIKIKTEEKKKIPYIDEVIKIPALAG